MTEQAVTEAPADVLPPPPGERQWPRPWMGPFLQALSVLPDVSSACRIARIGRTTAYEARDGVPERNGKPERLPVPGFAEAWEEAVALARDMVVQNAHRWITTGVPVRSVRTKTVRKTDASGSVIETTTETIETEGSERSSTLMIFWLKAWYPERFRWSERVEATGADGGPIRVESLDAIDRQIAELAAELEARDAAAVPESE